MPANRPDSDGYPSYQEAVRFFTALDFNGRGEDAQFAFQTFDESGQERDELTTSYAGALRRAFVGLKRVNLEGGGVHAGIHETDGKGRTEKNILRPRAVFIDFDGCEAPKETGAVPISMVVRSVNGPHLYWLLKAGEDLTQWRRVQKAVIARFGGDKSASTFTQTMRVPGFLHCKAEPTPVFIELLENRRYTLAELVDGFALGPELEALAAEEREIAKRQREAQSLAPKKPIESYKGRMERALMFLGQLDGTGSHRNDYITGQVAPIGWGFGIGEDEWADEACAWNDRRISPPLRHREVRSTIGSMYRRFRSKGSEPFGWRLEQDSDEWKEKQAKYERERQARADREEADWERSLSQEPPEPRRRRSPSSERQPEPPHPADSAPPDAAVGARDAFAQTPSPTDPPDGEFTLRPAAELLDLSTFAYLATPPLPDGHPLTLRGNAGRFVEKYSDQVRYSHPFRQFYVWDAKRWKKDEDGTTLCLAQQVVASIHTMMRHPEIRAIKGDDKNESARKYNLREAIKAHVKKSETPRGIKDLTEYASWQRSVIVAPDQLDRDDLLFNCDNGVFNIATGKLGPHDPNLYQTKVSKVAYVPDAKCPKWMEFLDWCMGGDKEMIRFLQRAAGYSLTGSTNEQVFFVCFGLGGNGKSTFINTVMKLAAGYSLQCPFEMFLSQGNRNSGSPNEELLALRGVRMAFASEPDEGARIKEDLIKQITGGEAISARPLWGKPIQFDPKFTLWFSCNHRPAIRGTDDGIWRRVVFVPWQANIDLTPEKKDLKFAETLAPEHEGILAWALAGAQEWHQNGLQVPERVRAATRGYRDDMDTLGDFLQLKTLRKDTATVASTPLYQAYCQWCDQTNETPWKQKTFSQRILERGIQTKRSRSGVVFVGIGLIDDKQDDDSPPPGQQELDDKRYGG